MVDQNCAYCMEGELVAKFGIKICELETSKVYLFKEQSHPGRCIVAHKKHVGDMNELTAEERAAYFEDVARVARAIMKAFNPDKVNYGAYGVLTYNSAAFAENIRMHTKYCDIGIKFMQYHNIFCFF